MINFVFGDNDRPLGSSGVLCDCPLFKGSVSAVVAAGDAAGAVAAAHGVGTAAAENRWEESPNVVGILAVEHRRKEPP